jgi:hypothetical protein
MTDQQQRMVLLGEFEEIVTSAGEHYFDGRFGEARAIMVPDGAGWKLLLGEGNAGTEIRQDTTES